MRVRDANDSFLRAVLHELPVLIVLIVLVTSAKQIGLLDPIERFAIDVFAFSAPDRVANHTAIIDINQDSYDHDFEKMSPLTLHVDKLASLLRAAFSAGARAVVVDIDIDDATIEKLEAAVGEANRDHIVWAVDGEACGTSHGCVRPAGLLGERKGLALFALDDDGAVRRYMPEFRISTAAGGPCACGMETHPSLPRLAVRIAGAAEGPIPEKPLLLNWSGRYAIPRLPASRVLADSTQPWWGKSQGIRGRVVLIGGTFREGRDTRWTPIGQLAAVEVFAHMVESEMGGGGLTQFHLAGAVAIEVLMGLGLIFLNWRFPAETRLSLLLNAVAVIVLPALASWLLYRFALFWVNLAPVLAGVWIHQWHTRARHLSVALKS